MDEWMKILSYGNCAWELVLINQNLRKLVLFGTHHQKMYLEIFVKSVVKL